MAQAVYSNNNSEQHTFGSHSLTSAGRGLCVSDQQSTRVLFEAMVQGMEHTNPQC